jgi:hypothetical protein
VEHLSPPEYHGNPVDERGSLVFTDIGWDVLAQAMDAGFSDACVLAYYSTLYGYVGEIPLLFVATR